MSAHPFLVRVPPQVPDGTYLVLPDMQIPYHDRTAVSKVLDFANWLKPDGILCVGDEADAPEVSRWHRGLEGEYRGTFESGLRKTYDVLHSFSQVAPMHLMRSNHTSTRIQNYLAKYAPALAGTSWNDYPRIMGFGQEPLLEGRTQPLDVTWYPAIWEFAPGWALAHGDEGGMSRIPGSTAMNLAKKIGVSVVCGHTHRAGLQHHTYGFAGRVGNVLYGLEVGNLMDIRKASYLKTGGGDWQQAFAVLSIVDRKVYPELVMFHGGNFIYQGQMW